MPALVIAVHPDALMRAWISSALARGGLEVLEAEGVGGLQALPPGLEPALTLVDGADPEAGAWLAAHRPGWPRLRLGEGGPTASGDGARGEATVELPATPEWLLARVLAALPPDGPASPVAAPTADLASRFAAELPQRIDALAQALHARADDAPRLARRLAVASATFGFVEVAAAAAALAALAARVDDEALARELPALIARARAGSRAVQVPIPSTRHGRGAGGVPLEVLLVGCDALPAGGSRVGRRLSMVLREADSIDEALAMIEVHRPDLLIVGLDGQRAVSSAEISATLRAAPGASRTPLALYASRSDLTTRLQARAAGGELLLTPPLTVELIEETARSLVEDKILDAPRAHIHAEDAAAGLRLRALAQSAGLEVSQSDQADGLIDALARELPELLVLHARGQGAGPLSLLAAVRSDPGWRDLPVIVAGGPNLPEARLAALRAGADALVPDPELDLVLGEAMAASVQRARARARRRSHDPLTGLMERSLLCEHLDARLSEARRRAETLALCVIALDDFDGLARSLGHRRRREVEAALGRILEERFRRHDLRALWARNRVVIALLDGTPATARMALARVLEIARAVHVHDEAGHPVRLRVSAGVSSFPVDGTRVEELVEAAQRRLAQAVQAGGDRVVA